MASISMPTAARCIPSKLRETVLRTGAHVGIALDGDGDRAMIVDERGELFDGDDVMALLGVRMAAAGRLTATRSSLP